MVFGSCNLAMIHTPCDRRMLKCPVCKGFDDPGIRDMHIKEFSDHRKLRLDTDGLRQNVFGRDISHHILGQAGTVQIVDTLDTVKQIRIHRTSGIDCKIAALGMSAHHPAPSGI